MTEMNLSMNQVNPRPTHPHPIAQSERENPQARMLLYLPQTTHLMIFCQHIAPVHPFDHVSVELFGIDHQILGT